MVETSSKTAEREIRKEFEEWLRDAAAKDLDAVMTKIADGARGSARLRRPQF